MNQTRLIAFSLTLLMLLLVLVAAFVFTYQAQRTLMTQVTTLQTAAATQQPAATRTSQVLATTAAQATAEAETSFTLESQLVQREQSLMQLTETLTNTQAALETTHATLVQLQQSVIEQPPQVQLTLAMAEEMHIVGDPFTFLIAAGDIQGIQKVEFTIGEFITSSLANQGRLWVWPVSHTFAEAGMYVATATAVNVNNRTTTVTTTIQLVTRAEALRTQVSASLMTLPLSAAPLPAPIIFISRAEFDQWRQQTWPTTTAAQQQLWVAQAFESDLTTGDGAEMPTDLEALLAEVAAVPFAALLYDATTDRFIPLTSEMLEGPLAEWVYAQEFAGTTAVAPPVAADFDTRLAGRAYAAGERALLLTLYLYRDELARAQTVAQLTELRLNTADALADLPAVWRAQLLFPYQFGFTYVAEVYAQGGLTAVAAARQTPPQTTAQLLGGEAQAAELVTLPDLSATLGSDWQPVPMDVLGVWRLQTHLQPWLAADVETAVSGWRGDRYAVYQNEATGELAWLLQLLWQTPAAATEFGTAYARLLMTRYGTEAVSQPDGSNCWVGDTDATCLYWEAETAVIVRAPTLLLARTLGNR